MKKPAGKNSNFIRLKIEMDDSVPNKFYLSFIGLHRAEFSPPLPRIAGGEDIHGKKNLYRACRKTIEEHPNSLFILTNNTLNFLENSIREKVEEIVYYYNKSR